MDCHWCYRQHLNSVNNYTVPELEGKLAETINSLDIINTSYLLKINPCATCIVLY